MHLHDLPFAPYRGCCHSSRSWCPQGQRNMPGGRRGWRRHRLGPWTPSPVSSPAGGSPECSGSTPVEEPLSRPGSRARCGQWPSMPRGSPPPAHGPPGCSAHRPGRPKSWWKRCLAGGKDGHSRWVMQRTLQDLGQWPLSISSGWASLDHQRYKLNIWTFKQIRQTVSLLTQAHTCTGILVLILFHSCRYSWHNPYIYPITSTDALFICLLFTYHQINGSTAGAASPNTYL